MIKVNVKAHKRKKLVEKARLWSIKNHSRFGITEKEAKVIFSKKRFGTR